MLTQQVATIENAFDRWEIGIPALDTPFAYRPRLADVGEGFTIDRLLLRAIADVSLDVARAHQLRGSAGEFERSLFLRLETTIADLSLNYADFRFGPDHWIAVVASAAYDVVLRHGFDGSFLDLQLSLWNSLRRVVRPSLGI